jgi:predicted alpha/beta-fold hydrolase
MKFTLTVCYVLGWFSHWAHVIAATVFQFAARTLWLVGAILGGAALIVAGITGAAGVVALAALVVPVLAVVWLLWEISRRLRCF